MAVTAIPPNLLGYPSSMLEAVQPPIPVQQDFSTFKDDPYDYDDSPGEEPFAASLMEAYHTPGRGNRGCPKGVCREGSGYVASIRINKRQQKGPVRSTIQEATRDRAQMMFMKATRSSADVELWIKSLKRKKRRATDKCSFIDNAIFADPSFGKQQLALALEQLMVASQQPLPEESKDQRDAMLHRIYQQQQELQSQQVQILQELIIAQQNIMLMQKSQNFYDEDDEEDDDDNDLDQ